MEKKYTDSFNQNLYIGYQCEWLADPTSTKGWKTVKLSGGIIPLIFDNKVTIRTPYLTPDLLISKGWKPVGTGKHEKFGPDVDIYEKHYDDHIEAEKEGGWMADGFRYSWYLSITSFKYGSYQGGEVKIAEKKSGGFCGSTENRVIFVGRIRNINELETASDLLGIKDYSDVIREELKLIPYLMPEDLKKVNSTSFVDKMRPYSDVFNAKKVRVIERFEIKDRGPVWIINTKECEFPTTLGGLRSVRGWLIRENDSDEVYEIIGVELPAVQNRDDMEMEHVSLLVKNRN